MRPGAGRAGQAVIDAKSGERAGLIFLLVGACRELRSEIVIDDDDALVRIGVITKCQQQCIPANYSWTALQESAYGIPAEGCAVPKGYPRCIGRNLIGDDGGRISVGGNIHASPRCNISVASSKGS